MVSEYIRIYESIPQEIGAGYCKIIIVLVYCTEL